MIQSSYTHATNRTRQKIRTAFADLLAEHGAIKNISVTDLAERADITRGTFYNYYNNLSEVAAELQAEIEKQLFANYHKFSSSDDAVSYINDVFSFLSQREGIYSTLLSGDAPSAFLEQLEKEITRRVLSLMRDKGIKDKRAKFELLMLVSGAFAIVRKYFRGEVDVSLDEIRNYLSAKVSAMFECYIG